MSCSKCGSVNTSCGCKDTAYTTPKVYTCPPDTSCPQPVRCSEFMDAACIFLNDGIADAGIQPGSSLESIVQQLILLVTNPGCVDADGGVPGGGTVTFIDAIWPGNAITIAGGPISNSGTFVFNGNGTSNQYIDGQGNLQNFPAISAPVEFQTNGTPNSTQVLLNLVAGTGVTLTEAGGSVTIDVDSNVYTVDNGLSADPTDANNFQLGSETAPGAPLIHDTYIAGSQFRFEINNTNSMYLQGNRVDVEGGSAGVMMLSTGGAADSSVEVTGVEVALDSTAGSNTTKIFLDPTKIRIQTPLYNLKDNGDVLTLIDKTTGEVEYMPVAGILLQTDGVDNADQELLNLVSGNGITLTNTGGDVVIDGPLFQTNGLDNSVQTLLNLVAGTGITLTETGGSVTIDAAAPAIVLSTNDPGGPATYNPLTGELNIPVYNYQIDIQEEGSSVYVNPQIINFIGTAVTATPTPTGVDVTITGAEYNGSEGVWKETSSLPETFMLGAPYGSGSVIKFTESREVDVDAYNLTFTGSANAAYTLYAFNTAGTALVGGAIYAEATSANQTGVYANSPLGTGFYTTAGEYGLIAFTTDSDYNTVLDVTPTDTTNISTVLELSRNNADTAGAGLQIVNKINQTVSSAFVTTAQTYGIGDTVTASNFEIQTVGASPIIATNFTIKGADGEIQLNQYGLGTFSNVATYVLGVDASGNVVETTVAGLTITVDSAPFSSSTAIDFVSSTDINITDLGGGQITFDLANPPVTYTSSEGIYDDSDVFKLGAPFGAQGTIPFLENRYVDTSTFKLYFQGSGSSNTVRIDNYYDPAPGQGNANEALEVYSQYASGIKASAISNYAIGVTGAGGTFGKGVYGVANGTGVEGYSTGAGIGGYFSNASAIVTAFNAANLGGYIAGTFQTVTTSTNSVTDNVWIETQSSNIAANGLGTRLKFRISPNSGLANTAPTDANALISKWFNATSGSAKSEFIIQGVNGGSLLSQFTILGGGTAGPAGAWSLTSGQIKFNRYFSGSIYKSADDLVAASGFNLGIDADGNIWATDFNTTTGPVSGVSNISIGTLSNGASATVNNPAGPSATIDITGQNAYTQIAADSGTASANVYNSQFSVIGASGITTSVTNGTMPTADVITVTGPNKYLNFVTKNISGTTIATYTPTVWNETLNIQAGSGITITNGGSPNTIIISGGAGTGTVSNVTGVNGNGFTVGVTNGTTTPAITVGTSITGVLVGNGTSVSAVTGTGVMVFSGTGYTFQALPTVNDGQIVLGANAAGATNTSVVLSNSAGGAFTANKATNSTYLLQIGPAISNLVTLMTAAMPVNPAVSGGAITALPPYIIKTGQDTYTVQTPVTTFSPGSTGFTVTSLVSSATTGAINGAVVLGGSLNVTSGGTGLTTAPGEGQILIGNSTGGFNIGNITAGNPGITVTSSGSGIQISATGSTVSTLNGIHTHSTDGSIRLGSGVAPDVITPLIELTDVRLNGQIYRLSNNNTGYITQVGFQIDDTTRQGFFGSSTSTTATTANIPQVGFMFTGDTGTPLTTFNGVYINRASLASTKVISGFSSGVTETFDRAANSIYQQGNWGGAAATSRMYEVIPASRTIQFGDISVVGNSNWIKLDDANQRVDFNKSTIYGSAYGTGAVTGVLQYLIGVDSSGKFFEFAGRSISQITGNTGTFSAASMASATAPVPFSIQGTGSITTSIAGNVLTISNSASAFPYWSTLNLSATAGGTVIGDANVIPNTVGANTLNLVAGSGITLTGTDSSNTIQISAGTVNAWYNIAVAGQSNLVPDAAQDTLTFAAGTGIQLTTNALTDTLTIASTGITSITNGGDPSISVSTVGGVTTISGNYNSNNGIYELNNNIFQLGAPSGLQSGIPFTVDRFIAGAGFKLDIESAMTAGRGVLHLTSTNVGRGLRAVNTTAASSTPEGAIYASSNQATSTDSNPTGTIYSKSSDTTNVANLGSAIVGVGTNESSEDSRPAIFGRGYIAVKGYNTIGQVESLSGFVSGGIGVYGASVYAAPVVPGTASPSVWGVVGSTISNTSMLLGWVTNVGTGVYGEAAGGVRTGANLGTGSDLKTFGGRFVINPSGNTALPTTTTPGLNTDVPVGIRSMVNVADVLQIVRLSSTAAGSILGGVGGAIVFNIESNSTSTLSDGDKAGRVGYKLENISTNAGTTVTSRSRFFATVKDGTTAGETERLAVRSSGQVEFSAYSFIEPALPPNIETTQGVFTPDVQLTGAADYDKYYDYCVLGVKTRAPFNNEGRGRIDTLRTRHGQFLPSLANINGIIGIQASAGISMTVLSYLFKSLNSVVTCHITGNVVVTTTGAKTLNIPLPVPALLNIASDDIAMSWNFNTFSAYTGGFTSVSVAGNGTNQRCTITLSGATAGTYSYSAIITYITYN